MTDESPAEAGTKSPPTVAAPREVTQAILFKAKQRGMVLIAALKKSQAGEKLTAEETETVLEFGSDREAGGKLPTYPTMKNGSKAAGIPMFVLKQAKSAGCTAFRANSGFALGEFLPWFFAQLEGAGEIPKGLGSWQDAKNMEQSKIFHVQRMKVEGSALDKADVEYGLNKGQALLSNSLRQIFINQMPAQVVGMTEVQISAKFTAEIDRMEAHWREELGKLSEGKT